MGAFSLIKGTKRPEETPVVISNLDKILSKPVAFILHGRTHVVNPIPLDKHLEFAHALVEFGSVKDKTNLQDLQVQYYKTIHPIVPSLTLEDIRVLPMIQLTGLTSLINKIITGEIHIENDSQKKNP